MKPNNNHNHRYKINSGNRSRSPDRLRTANIHHGQPSGYRHRYDSSEDYSHYRDQSNDGPRSANPNIYRGGGR